MLPSRLLIFTALEGTLLDARTESFAGAEQALAEIERRKIPLILATSKTRAQLDGLRRKLGHSHPFISENGGGIFIPDVRSLKRRLKDNFLCDFGVLSFCRAQQADAIDARGGLASHHGANIP